MAEFSYFYCGLCRQWKPSSEYVRLKKEIVLRGYLTFGICRPCAQKLLKRKAAKAHAR